LSQRTTSQEFETSPRQTTGGFFYTGLGEGHATIAPCRCPSCDKDTRAYLERERAELAQRSAVEAKRPPSCPRCAGAMTLQTNSRDGRTFWGCVDYPTCKGSRTM
jgi:hypothetical protein